MQNLTLVGNTGKYMYETKKEDGRTQYSFTIFVNNGKDKDATAYPCFLTGDKEKLKGIISNLFIPKGTEKNSKGEDITVYHSRVVSTCGRLSVYKEAQDLPVSYAQDIKESVIGLSIGVHVNNIEFHDARPGKEEGATVSTANKSKEDIDAMRKALEERKKTMLGQALEK